MHEYNNYLIDSNIFSSSSPLIKGYWKFDSTDPTLASDYVNNNVGFFEGNAIKVEGKYGKGEIIGKEGKTKDGKSTEGKERWKICRW